MEQKIKRFLDDRGRLKQVPSKSSVRKEALQYLSDKFDDDKKYTEKEVNQVLTEWSTIGDYSLLHDLGRSENNAELKKPDYYRTYKEALLM